MQQPPVQEDVGECKCIRYPKGGYYSRHHFSLIFPQGWDWVLETKYWNNLQDILYEYFSQILL